MSILDITLGERKQDYQSQYLGYLSKLNTDSKFNLVMKKIN